MSWSPVKLVAILLASLPLVAGSAAAQESGDWNSPRALELIERARARRSAPAVDSGLVNYQASATGYVYYYLDRKDSDERNLVKVDQIALDLYWGEPDRTKQRIVGLRDVSRLPNRMRYHLDHLTVVQDEFGDVIRMGDGDEVRDVPHPAAPGSEAIYEFRLADSLTLRLAGATEPIRVYEVAVRPRRLDRPAFIGSVFLDRASAAIVRMSFTFTPASYVDRRLDYIRVSLDNGLWDGRYWLPNEQEFEIRRQVPEFDFPAGGVIRGVLRIGGYRFNEHLPENFFRGARVVVLPRHLREEYAFDHGIYDGLGEAGLSASADLAALRRRAIELVGRRYLSGLPRLRLSIPPASSILRYNRAEELYLGGGASYATGASSALNVGAGYATGPGHLAVGAVWTTDPGDAMRFRIRADLNGSRDLGLRPGVPGVFNTMAAAFAGEDYLDPYYATGIGLEAERRLGGGTWVAALGLRYEEHAAASLADTAAPFDGEALFRPIRSITEGRLGAAELVFRRTGPPAAEGGWHAELALEGGLFEGNAYFRPVAEVGLVRWSADRRTTLEARAAAGLVAGDSPPQALFLLGGPATLPGYDYRSFVGSRFALVEGEASREVLGPWVRLRATGAVGWTGLGSDIMPAGWPAGPTDGLRANLGAGLGLVYDVLRLDLARGLGRAGDWRLILSVRPDLRDLL